MKNILNKARKLKEDDGAANTVSFIVIVFFIMILLISFIDVGLYFNVKNEMQSAAENGARNVALYGGTNNILRSEMSGDSPENVVNNSINQKFHNGKGGLVEVAGNGVNCYPAKANAGDKVSCTVDYEYKGLAGKFGLFNLANDKVKVEGSSVSEVSIK